MVSLETVRASNTALKSLPPLVAVFVGGTSGIGLYTARELARNTTSPHIYLIGRNQPEASKIIDELKSINSSSQVSFIQKDVSLLRNVDEACKEIQSKEKHVNLLFMTCGYFVFTGRDETPEGLDKKFALHYYTRMRFINQLQPLLDTAAGSKQLSRVVSVLDPQIGLRLGPNFSDLSLKTTFSLKNCATHASAMTNLFFSRLAAQHADTSYIHVYPAFVDSGAGREAYKGFGVLLKPLMWAAKMALQVKPAESGERHLYAATSSSFAPRGSEGGDKEKGSYLLNWNNDLLADTNWARKMREEGKGEVVQEHTEDVFKKVCAEGGKY